MVLQKALSKRQGENLLPYCTHCPHWQVVILLLLSLIHSPMQGPESVWVPCLEGWKGAEKGPALSEQILNDLGFGEPGQH